MKKITKYACEYCPTTKKSYMSSTPVKKHEEICYYNPKNKTCLTCIKWGKEQCYCEHPEIVGCPIEYWNTYNCDYLCDLIDKKETIEYGDCHIIKDCLYWNNKINEQETKSDW